MFRRFVRLSRRQFWLVVLFGVIVLQADASSSGGKAPAKANQKNRPSLVTVGPSNPDPAAVQMQPDRLAPGVLISLYPMGFTPRVVYLDKRSFVLSVNDMTGLDELSLQLFRLNGPKLREVDVSRELTHWSEPVDLSPGTYILTEKDHREWECRIVVREK